MRPVRGATFVAAAALAAAIFTGAAFASTAKISFVDVGQGDGVVMRIGSKIVVSDAGQFKYEDVDAALHALGAKQVDVAILSHPHSDHDTDFLSLFDEWKVREQS